ncbi:MAG: ABC transporter permease [Thermoleophilia bacterium]|nr:ABC transporter permease [Thermoleophilia bacterium]
MFWFTWWFNLRLLTASRFFVLVSVLEPLIFATIAFYLWGAGGREQTLLYVALGAGLMGMWSATLFGSGGLIQWQRWQRTLELLVAAPPRFLVTALPFTVATASLGLYSVAATLLWGRLLFGVPLAFEHPFLFLLALPATVLALGVLGLVFASTFVFYRHANAFSNLLEYPVWLASGVLVPVSLLPGFVEPLSWALAPTWGVRALRDAAFGGNPLPEIGACLALAVAYLTLAAVAMANFERLARRHATLSLT